MNWLSRVKARVDCTRAERLKAALAALPKHSSEPFTFE